MNTSKHKSGRGPSKMPDSWGTSRRLDVHVEGNEILGKDSNLLKSALGTIARNGQRLPLTYSKWNDVPSTIIDEIWEDIQVGYLPQLSITQFSDRKKNF